MTGLPMAPSPSYPRQVTQVHQIEVTTQCNLRCVYCPSPKLEKHRGKPKQHMTLDTFERALEWCDYFQRRGTQGELSLTGIGETLLHPDWKDMVRLARETLPNNFLNFSTNGLLLDDDACAHLAEYGFGVYVSLHRPEKAGRALERAKKHGILMTYNASAAISSFDWAGQVDWYVSADRSPCEWLREGWCNVLVDGRVTRCCLDATGKGTFSHVDSDPKEALTSPWELCNTCHQVP